MGWPKGKPQRPRTAEEREKIRVAKIGSRNPAWKGGRTVKSDGYVLIKVPDHPAARSDRYAFEHRVIAEQKIGRRLLPGEHVHHVNGVKADNRPENLEVLSAADHIRHHAPHTYVTEEGRAKFVVAREAYFASRRAKTE